MQAENQITITIENCNTKTFLDFCESWNQITEVRPSEPPETLGTPGWADFFISVAGSLSANGILWLIPFMKEWRRRRAGILVVVKINGEEISVKGRNAKEIEIDIKRTDEKIRVKKN